MDLSWLYPMYLGPYGENDHVLERYINTFIRDHVYWRRNLYPSDLPSIPVSAQYSKEFTDFVSNMAQELHMLSSDLKRSVPWFSPRYLGHMASDLLLPGILAQMITSLYNPNNVAEDASPGTLSKELEVGKQLANMFGMSTNPQEQPCAWGHLTSGGTVANYESLWQARCAKFYPVALAQAARKHNLKHEITDQNCWQWINYNPQKVLSLRHEIFQLAMEQGIDQEAFFETVKEHRLGTMGVHNFFQTNNLKSPVIFISTTAHYSWEKAMKVLGLGTAQLNHVEVDAHMRLDIHDLNNKLLKCQQEEIPVLALVGVLGTTEFGVIDPIDKMVQVQKEFQQIGLYAWLHVDGAFGGYFASIFRNPDGSLREKPKLQETFRYFPSDPLYNVFASIHEVDSITVDPHKLGYLPYPSGAFVAKNREIAQLVAQEAPYVFDIASQKTQDFGEELKHLGKYILEGSKPGSSAAAAYVTHRVLPLNSDGMGKVVGNTIQSCEYFFELVHAFAKRAKEKVTVSIPFHPDTNLLCVALNPKGNTSIAKANQFTRKVFEKVKIRLNIPVQTNQFFASFTSILDDKISEVQKLRICKELGLDPATFVSHPQNENSSNHLFVLRHTLMNPWLMVESKGSNYLDKYLDFIEETVNELMP